MNFLNRFTTGALLSLSLVNLAFSAPETDWPKKPIVAVLSFPAGGSTDVFARAVVAPLSEALGQSVVVENKPGAGGMIGLGAAAKAAPDGYTILLALSSLTVIPEADALLGRNPMFLLNELRPIARYTADPTVLAVRADAPWKNVKEFIEDARKRPGAINYGSSGNYGTMHVPM